MEHRRGQPTRRPPGRLQAIAPRDEIHVSPADDANTAIAQNVTAAPSRSHMPPRSRSGCWYVTRPFSMPH